MLQRKPGHLYLFTLIIAALLVLSACGGSVSGGAAPAGTENTPQQNSAQGGEATAPEKILVGTSGLVYPVTFYDEDNNLTGVDVRLTEEIFKRLPEYEYEWYVADLVTLFIAVDTNKIQMIAHNIGKNPERLAKYLYGDKPHNRSLPVIAFQKGRTDIQTMDDLKGKTMPFVGDGALAELYFEKYNETEAADNPVNMQYGIDINSALLGASNGRYDAADSSVVGLDNFYKTYGIELDYFPIPNGHELNAGDGAYLVYHPDQTELKEKIDAVLQELKDDGTLLGIFKEFYGDHAQEIMDQVNSSIPVQFD
ncbi:MAG: transporter substrate-binding domain-containing protein [Gracilibacteraceae bacterium]|jgi:L-cystine transport system substrate-binding protein|nr:transporter substrate-binding domain-containing protein [Gracilibacteraceae bacterium]